MRTANRKTEYSAIYKQLAEIDFSERDRQRAARALRDAAAIVDVVIWVKERITSFGAMLPKPGFKH